MKINWRYWPIIFIGLALIIALLWAGPIPQPPAYNDFADARQYFYIPNFLNVVSNLLFLFVGANGILQLSIRKYRNKISFSHFNEIIFYYYFFVSMILIAFGSGYYHWTPNDNTIIWDRIPMCLGFSSFFAAMVGERISYRVGWSLLPIYFVFGIFSVFYWYWTETLSEGDIRFYAFFQAFPLLVIPWLLIGFNAVYTGVKWIWIALLLFYLARVFEAFDIQIFNWTGFLSGHTLKHLFAGFAAYCIWRYLVVRRIKF